MKKLRYILIAVSMFAAVACADDTLDPLQFNYVKKGSLLALRGTQLEKIYFEGKPGAEFFPKIATGSEKFEFDAEYLSESPDNLESVDVFVVKGSGASTQRVLLRTVPFSEFKRTNDYRGPWVTISFAIADILSRLDIPNAFPLSNSAVSSLLTTYKFGIQVECDLNLRDGAKVLASEMVAAGLYSSNQFYPAQKLTYTVTDYCSFNAAQWAGDYEATENSEFNGSYGPYGVSISASSTANRFNIDNWYDQQIPIYIVFEPSVDVDTQIVKAPLQADANNEGRTIEGVGVYNQCLGEITMDFTYKNGDTILDKFVWKLKK